MSNDKFSWLLRQTGTLAEMSLLQVFVIACHHRETTIDGRVFPPFHVWLSAAEIARRSGLNDRTIPVVAARLTQRGLIKSAGRHGKTGQIRVYRLLIDATETLQVPAPLEDVETLQVPAPFDVSESLHVSALKGAGSCIERVHVPASAYIGIKRELKREVKREEDTHARKRPSKMKLPSNINREAWDGYLDMRRQNGKKLTDRAKTLLLNKLVSMAMKGHDPNQALEEATVGCWSSVYPPKQGPASKPADDWRAEQRRRTQQAAPGVAVKDHPADCFIEAEDVPFGQQARLAPVLMTFADWYAAAKALNPKVLPEDDPIHDYMTKVGMNYEFMVLHWHVFKAKHLSDTRLRSDWPQAFRDSVKGNYGRLWYRTDDGAWKLTVAGKQAALEHECDADMTSSASRDWTSNYV